MTGFRFKKFEILQDHCAMKVGTDGVLLGAWASGGTRILDIGCGTGLIALMMVQRFPAAQVVGLILTKRLVDRQGKMWQPVLLVIELMLPIAGCRIILVRNLMR